MDSIEHRLTLVLDAVKDKRHDGIHTRVHLIFTKEEKRRPRNCLRSLRQKNDSKKKGRENKVV